MNTYKVKKGDNLWNIAEKELGDGSRFPEIVALNSLNNHVIFPGQILRLPVSEVSEPDAHYKKVGKLFETALQDISKLPSVKELIKEMERTV